jgi:hypothetical protein
MLAQRVRHDNVAFIGGPILRRVVSLQAHRLIPKRALYGFEMSVLNPIH